MIPIYSRVRRQRIAYSTWLLVLTILISFCVTLQSLDARIWSWGMIPNRLLGEGASLSAYATVLTYTFLHAGWFHLLSNLLALVVFGTATEQKTGSATLLLIYISSGLMAAIMHCWLTPQRSIPCCGASGAVSGILGASLILTGRARLLWLVLTFLVETPVWFFVLAWFALQLYGFQHAGEFSADGSRISFESHLGGFFCGIVIGAIIDSRGRISSRNEHGRTKAATTFAASSKHSL